jgi:hypothetical protein
MPIKSIVVPLAFMPDKTTDEILHRLLFLQLKLAAVDYFRFRLRL